MPRTTVLLGLACALLLACSASEHDDHHDDHAMDGGLPLIDDESLVSFEPTEGHLAVVTFHLHNHGFNTWTLSELSLRMDDETPTRPRRAGPGAV